MSYQVLARKWRPHNFLEMVGQEHVLRMLTNALDNQRLHHAYLFTGTRGVGKTTLARILAKCLNCEQGIRSNPCGQCNACQSIDTGRFLDLIEVDAASRTKVEDTRELLDNVQYAPSQGRFKIYLIDEVHMLSGHSFNALLKTLEEPPAHVKFLLATTDPKRLPITVLSRCLQFNLKRVPIEQIAKQLQYICQTENVSFEAPALDLLAEAADGSMRDALSLLDQTIAFCSQTISVQDTRQMLGSIEQDAIYRLLDALAQQDGKKLLAEIAHLAELAPDFHHALEDILTALHQISLVQVLKDTAGSNEKIKQLAAQLTPEETQLYYQIALIGRRDLSLAPNPLHGFEMVMLRMLAFQPTTETPPRRPVVASSVDTSQPTKMIPPVAIQKENTESFSVSKNWADILPKLELAGFTQTIASNCILVEMTDTTVHLAITATHATLLNKKQSDRIEEALVRYLKKPIKLNIAVTSNEIQTPAKQHQEDQLTRQMNAETAIQGDSNVQKIVELFNATLDVNSIKAVDSV